MRFERNNIHELLDLRKECRDNLTLAEKSLWNLLKNKQFEGKKFRRQHSVGRYILDFYCPEEHLGIELDGDVHSNDLIATHDLERDKYLASQGIRILRFENKIVFENPHGLLEEIKMNLGWKKKDK